MSFKTYKIEEYKSGNWVGVASTLTPNEYTGLTSDQTQDVINYFLSTRISTSNHRETEET